jgi:hypothetical protein
VTLSRRRQAGHFCRGGGSSEGQVARLGKRPPAHSVI